MKIESCSYLDFQTMRKCDLVPAGSNSLLMTSVQYLSQPNLSNGYNILSLGKPF